MKKILLILVIIITAVINPFGRNTVFAGNHDVNKSTIINQLDTVVFDLTKAVIAGNKIWFPVYMLTDDTDIVALDFSLKYNLAKLAYDTILPIPSYIQGLPNQDASHRIAYTSYTGGQNYVNDTPLVYIRFTWLSSGQICDTDLDSVKGYLNGTTCSVKIPSSCLSVGLPEVNIKDNFFTIFPNPSQGDFTIFNKYSNQYHLEIYDIFGKEIYFEHVTESTKRFRLNLMSGIYFVKLSYNGMILNQKLIIQ